MKNRKFILSMLTILVGLTANSQDSKKQQDIKAIKSMCGCYEVKFNFIETFNYAKDSINYKPSKTKHDYGLEWVELVEDQPNKIVLQHLLITGKTEESIVSIIVDPEQTRDEVAPEIEMENAELKMENVIPNEMSF